MAAVVEGAAPGGAPEHEVELWRGTGWHQDGTSGQYLSPSRRLRLFHGEETGHRPPMAAGPSSPTADEATGRSVRGVLIGSSAVALGMITPQDLARAAAVWSQSPESDLITVLRALGLLTHDDESKAVAALEEQMSAATLPAAPPSDDDVPARIVRHSTPDAPLADDGVPATFVRHSTPAATDEALTIRSSPDRYV